MSKLCQCGHGSDQHGNPFTKQPQQHPADVRVCLNDRCNCVEFTPKAPSSPTFTTRAEHEEQKQRDLPIEAFNAVTEECYYGHTMRMALGEDPAACEVFLRIAARTKQLRTAAERVLKRVEPRRGE